MAIGDAPISSSPPSSDGTTSPSGQTEAMPLGAPMSDSTPTRRRRTPSILEGEERRATFVMAREALLGLALGRATSGGRPLAHEPAVLDQLRRVAGGIA